MKYLFNTSVFTMTAVLFFAAALSISGCSGSLDNNQQSSSSSSSSSLLRTSWSYSSVPSAYCNPAYYCTAPFECPITNLVLNSFNTTVQNGHTQVIYSKNGNAVSTNSLIIKEDISILYACEQTPVVFKGTYYDVISVHPSTDEHDSNDCYIAVMTAGGANTIVSITGRICQYASAIAVNGTLYIYATCWDQWHAPWVFYTTDLINWQSNQCFTPGTCPTVWNTSVCYDGSRFVMTMDIGSYYQSFSTSADGLTFTPVNNSFTATAYDTTKWNPALRSSINKIMSSYNYNGYTGCAVLRYASPYYYLIYCTQDNGLFINRIVRSADLVNWVESVKNPVLVPDSYDQAIPTCVNASDLDLVEYNGQVHFYYCVADQVSWFNIRRAYYPGTLADFLNWFF
ncbi:MAG: hypothetical protein ABSG94_01130 [Brevinematales bacterium]